MTGKTMLYSGIVIPGAIVAQIETRAAAAYPEFKEHAGAFEVGALMAFCGRMPTLGISTVRAEAFRDGQMFGASLRSIRCHTCKGRGISECGTVVCTDCDGSGEAARLVTQTLDGIRQRMHAGTESIRAELHRDIDDALGRFGVKAVVHTVALPAGEA